jgi:hypothetical protein
MGEMRSAYMVLVGKSERKSLVGRPRLRWKNDFETFFQELKWGPGLDWSGSGWGQVVGALLDAVMNLRFP